MSSLTVFRLTRRVSRLRVLLALFLCPAMLLAQTPVPAAAPAVPMAPAVPLPPGLEAEIQLLRQQVEQLKGNWGGLQQSIPPVMKTAEKIDALPKEFHPRVNAIKAKYDIPEKPTLGQEAKGLTRYAMDRMGVQPERQGAIMKAIDQTAANARNYKPMDPLNIALAVGSVAGMNVIGQLSSTGQVDVGKAVGFIATPQFWGGLVGSGVGYSLAAIALTTFLPPGGGIVASVLPTFGAMTASILGGHVGSAGFDMKKALANVNFGEVIGQAAGSTIGLFAGGVIGQFLGGTLGSMAGPVGTVLGSMMMGWIGGTIGKGITQLFKGDTETLKSALEKATSALNGEGFRPSELGIAEELPGSAFYNDTESVRVKGVYRASYTGLVEAMKKGDRKTAESEFKTLQTARHDYEQLVRKSFREMAARQAAGAH
ncbi:MAG: hypothetical protein HYY25_03170 [Candidatus Wallbacteria bacterium]|nr:hypothetical protein [Candidatus Wallbacteria bacterium]MBI4867841.1 hypothetical protein [Candidatus Wallbacteria bacterium]